MQKTMKRLCEEIQGCVFGYTQSDEITLILCDYQTLNTSAFFNYEVQKICSITASMATLYFNKFFNEAINNKNYIEEPLLEKYKVAALKGAMFDARCFNIPKEEVANLIYWRQLDAIRNSIQMCGHYYFSDNEMAYLSCNKIKDKLLTEKSFNWNNLNTELKYGSSCIKMNGEKALINVITEELKVIQCSYWKIDNEMPLIKGENRIYIENLINFN